ncbi:Transposase [Anoxybacillus thermarum]|uniref:Transposase n=1 Tax=Anoxybacillus thermarum TaxID=404937 RepID=A0A0D0RWQ6_9BACL|nr:transposase family protein [Anoxybacillus thermarum]KIQ93141.1 Transposase [Anoxybacillus thermarum]
MINLSCSPLDSTIELLDVSDVDDSLRLTVKSNRESSSCPACHHVSSRPHSRHTRVIQDLPIADRPVRLLLISRKWFCDDPSCSLKVFTERYDWLAPHGRRTLRAEHILRQIAFSTSCVAAEKIAQAIHLPISHDSLLTMIHKTPIPVEVSPFPRSR